MHDGSGQSVAMAEHAVVIAGGGPTGLMLAAELALARVDVAVVERRGNQDLAGSRAGGLHARTIGVRAPPGVVADMLSGPTPRARVVPQASAKRISRSVWRPPPISSSYMLDSRKSLASV